MKMKQFIATIAAVAVTVSATAQSVDEGVKMYRYERYTSAKKILEPLAATNPTANYYYGLAELELGNVEAAKQAFVKYPDDYANIGGTVRVKFATEGEAAGMQAAKALADMKKKEWAPKRYAADAITYSKGGDKQQAVNWYTEVLAKMNTPEILVSTGDAYLQIPSGGGQAMTHFEKAIEKDPKFSLAYSRIGKLMYNAKNYEVALENWKKAQEADPTNPLPYYDMANAYTYVGKYEVAKQNMEKYMQYSDNSTEDVTRYMEILYLSKDYPAAIAKVNELKAKGVDNVRFYGILAYSYMEDKDSVAGVKALENVRTYFSKQSPDKLYAQDYMKQGQIMMRNNLGQEANASFNKALEKETPENKINIYRDIAESFRGNKDWMNAAMWYEKIYADFADKANANDYFWGGYSYYLASTAKTADANTVLTKADGIFNTMTTKFPEQPSGFYWRGRVNAAMDSEGEKGLATPYFEQWLTMNADGQKKSEKDLQYAYQYLTAYYYTKQDKPNANKYADLVLSLDANNAFAKQVKDLLKKG